MRVLEEYNTTVELDEAERFDVEWTDDYGSGATHRVRVDKVQRYVYPAQGGGHGRVVNASGLQYRKDGRLGARRKSAHNDKALHAAMPELLRDKLNEIGMFAEVPDGA